MVWVLGLILVAVIVGICWLFADAPLIHIEINRPETNHYHTSKLRFEVQQEQEQEQDNGTV